MRWLATLILGIVVPACSGDGSPDPTPEDPAEAEADDQGAPDGPTVADTEVAPEPDEWETLLEARETDYNAALRSAALRLVGDLPTLLEIKFVEDAQDPRAAYEALVDGYLEDPRFARQLLSFFRDTFKMGETARLDTAPVFATQLVVEGRDFTELFTAPRGTCPTLDLETGAFEPADCDNGVPVAAGILTNPGVQAQFTSNLALRRVRWVQETFVCTRFPAEVGEGRDVGGEAEYTAPWPWGSIAGAENGGRVDFLDSSSVICANCHATMNHVAPLFAHFDAEGQYGDEIAVTVPIEGVPFAVTTDWLPAGQGQTAWRLGEPAPDLVALGAAIAADPDVAECSVARMWNWALGRGDIVLALAVVPSEVIQAYVVAYVSSGHRLKETIRAVFTSEDFTKYPVQS